MASSHSRFLRFSLIASVIAVVFLTMLQSFGMRSQTNLGDVSHSSSSSGSGTVVVGGGSSSSSSSSRSGKGGGGGNSSRPGSMTNSQCTKNSKCYAMQFLHEQRNGGAWKYSAKLRSLDCKTHKLIGNVAGATAGDDVTNATCTAHLGNQTLNLTVQSYTYNRPTYEVKLIKTGSAPPSHN